MRYSSISLVVAAQPRTSRVRRHLPFGLFLVALGGLVLALARPAAVVSVPTGQTSILLVIDVSRSMCSTDIPPSRLLAAEAAAADFIQSQGSTTQIGIVAFAGFAELVQAPTTDQEVLLDAVRSLTTTGRRTAVGSGILAAIDAIAEIDPNVARPSVSPFHRRRADRSCPGAFAPTSSWCSPMRRATPGPTRPMPPSRRPIAASACTPSGSARPTVASRIHRAARGSSATNRPAAVSRRRRVRRWRVRQPEQSGRAGIDEEALKPVASLTRRDVLLPG